MKIIYKAADITEAHIVKGLLESNGIEAHVGGFYLQGAIGDLAAQDFAHVHVADEDQQRANEIISVYESNSNPNPGIAKQQPSKENQKFNKLVLTAFIAVSIIAIYGLAS
jgi:hypothetical protein